MNARIPYNLAITILLHWCSQGNVDHFMNSELAAFAAELTDDCSNGQFNLYQQDIANATLEEDASIPRFKAVAGSKCMDWVSCPLGDTCYHEDSKPVNLMTFLDQSVNKPVWLCARTNGLAKTRVRFSIAAKRMSIHLCVTHHGIFGRNEDWATAYPIERPEDLLYESDIQALELKPHHAIAADLHAGSSNLTWKSLEHRHDFYGIETCRVMVNGSYNAELVDPSKIDDYVFKLRPELLESAINRGQVLDGYEVIKDVDRVEKEQHWVIPPLFTMEELSKILRIPYLFTYDEYGYPMSTLYREILEVLL